MKSYLKTIAILLPLAACNGNIYSPPSRTMALSAPEVMEAGKTAVRGSVSSASAIFGPELRAGSAGIRHGMKGNTEVVLDVSYARVDQEVDANQSVGMARVGGKFNPEGNPDMALTGGFGGGISPAAGSFASADVGAVFGYQNKYAVPFLSVSGYVSVPINAKEVLFRHKGSKILFDDRDRDTAETTLGASVGLGLRVPIQSSALTLGLTLSTLRDDDTVESFLGAGIGAETSF